MTAIAPLTVEELAALVKPLVWEGPSADGQWADGAIDGEFVWRIENYRGRSTAYRMIGSRPSMILVSVEIIGADISVDAIRMTVEQLRPARILSAIDTGTLSTAALCRRELDAAGVRIAALTEALGAVEGRVETATDLCHDATDWFETQWQGVSIFEWIFQPARAALNPKEAP